MKKFTCDICGNDVSQYDLRELYEKYAPKNINDVCEDCYKEIQGAILKIEDALRPIKGNWVYRIIEKMIGSNSK